MWKRDLWDFHNAIFIRELIVIVGDFQYFIDCFWWYWYLIKFVVNIPINLWNSTKNKQIMSYTAMKELQMKFTTNRIYIWHEDLLSSLQIIIWKKNVFYCIHYTFLLRQTRTIRKGIRLLIKKFMWHDVGIFFKFTIDWRPWEKNENEYVWELTDKNEYRSYITYAVI